MKGERGDRVNARTRRASVSPCLARAIPANAREAAGPQSRLLLFSSWGTYQLRISRHQVCCNRSGQSGRNLNVDNGDALIKRHGISSTKRDMR
ncbi:uncharacterized protein LOC114254404 isoform X3 [Monomorium pharaonis]|uniref:uncharacterized protein LOC114254404 isoform X3 n=1 Tax=Monomorium pharaonis TaxID=307658 RepID=UPI00102E2095|nr:uncharacterized protein LOC114254404 isoform X3 [Monomorium pharaonis]